jgi:outer membrane lipoprotein SlyB
MLRKLMLTAGAVAALATGGAIDAANAHSHHRVYQHRHNCHAQSHRSGAIGAVAGAIGGGIIGSAIAHGNGPSTLLGAGAGALAGHAIGKSSVRCG